MLRFKRVQPAGLASVALGAGRQKKGEPVDPAVGIILDPVGIAVPVVPAAVAPTPSSPMSLVMSRSDIPGGA